MDGCNKLDSVFTPFLFQLLPVTVEPTEVSKGILATFPGGCRSPERWSWSRGSRSRGSRRRSSWALSVSPSLIPDLIERHGHRSDSPLHCTVSICGASIYKWPPNLISTFWVLFTDSSTTRLRQTRAAALIRLTQSPELHGSDQCNFLCNLNNITSLSKILNRPPPPARDPPGAPFHVR